MHDCNPTHPLIVDCYTTRTNTADDDADADDDDDADEDDADSSNSHHDVPNTVHVDTINTRTRNSISDDDPIFIFVLQTTIIEIGEVVVVPNFMSISFIAVVAFVQSSKRRFTGST